MAATSYAVPGASRPKRAVVASTIPMTIWTFHGELLRQLGEAGYDVLVVSSPGRDLGRLEQAGHRTAAVAMTREISPRADAAALSAWVRLLRRERPDLVVAATPKASLLAMLAARLTGVPTRLYYCGGLRLEGESGARRALLAFMERLTGACSTDIVVNSPSLLALSRRLRLFPARKTRATVPASSHGVDTGRFQPGQPDAGLRASLGLAPDVPTVVFVGRLTRDKGIDALVDALGRLRADAVPVQLMVVGPVDEPDSQAYLDLLRHAIPDVVTSGHVDDVRPYFHLASIHVLPSLREGFPNVVLEASACGLPTVTTTATGCVDAVRDGETGFLVPPEDGAALAARIRALIEDADRARQMGRCAREWVVQDFEPSRVVASLLGPAVLATAGQNA